MTHKKITLVVIIGVLGLIFYTSFHFIYKSSTDNIIDQQVETSKIQADIVSKILEQQIEMGFNKAEIIEGLQKSIQNSSTEYSFICMFDTTGKELCHPDVDKIGQVLTKNNSICESGSNINGLNY